MGDKRFITLGEYEFLQPIFRQTLRYERLRVVQSVLLPRFKVRGLVLGQTIRIAPDEYYADFSRAPLAARALFAHEVTHVWQRQNLAYHEGRALMEHVRHRGTVYHYEADPDLELTDYRFEQQGSIVQDYVYRREKYPREAHWPMLERTIHRSIDRLEGLGNQQQPERAA